MIITHNLPMFIFANATAYNYSLVKDKQNGKDI